MYTINFREGMNFATLKEARKAAENAAIQLGVEVVIAEVKEKAVPDNVKKKSTLVSIGDEG